MIRYNGRTLTVGPTESGKSELINVQFTAMRCQKVLYDSKDEFGIEGVRQVVGDVDAVDWRQPVIHFTPGDDVRGDAAAFFAAAFQRRHLVIAVHELADLCEYNANAAPSSVSRYWRQGARHGLGILGGTQRPVGNPKCAWTELNDVYLFVPALIESDDHDRIAKAIGRRPDELAAALEALQADQGPYSYFHWDRSTRELTPYAPLPEKVRKRSIVFRTSVA